MTLLDETTMAMVLGLLRLLQNGNTADQHFDAACKFEGQFVHFLGTVPS